ncbi:MAG TPA: cation transporter [Clostridiaceae bacterium]|nr:cation transporter [Clostridiaceae bacterium]
MVVIIRLAKILIKNHEQVEDTKVRQDYGRLMSSLGIASNLLLSAIKFIAGTITGSIAITSDAWNNATDSIASVVALVSFKLSAKPPDKKHPYGHARFEYIASSLVALIIILVAWELFKTSIGRVINPQQIALDYLVVVILILSILIKLWQWQSYRQTGKLIDSQVFRATSVDSLGDAITTASVLVGTLIAHFSGLMLDGWIGLLVSLFIFWSGFNILRETATSLLGGAPPEDLVKALEDKILSYPEVFGMHDLLIHDYGPGKMFASVHVEIDANLESMDSHELIDRIERDVFAGSGVHLIIHLDPVLTDDPQLDDYREKIGKTIIAVSSDFRLHDFRLMRSEEGNIILFDLEVPGDYPHEEESIKHDLQKRIKAENPGISCLITIDRYY